MAIAFSKKPTIQHVLSLDLQGPALGAGFGFCPNTTQLIKNNALLI